MQMTTFDGTVEALGQGKTKDDFQYYAYIRLRGPDGKSDMIEKVQVANFMNSHLALGLSGRFAFVEGGAFSMLVAVIADGQLVNGTEDSARLMRSRKWGLFRYGFFWMILTFWICGVGFLAMILALIGMCRLPSVTAMTDEDLRPVLEAAT
jgi:hypothetical protein